MSTWQVVSRCPRTTRTFRNHLDRHHPRPDWLYRVVSTRARRAFDARMTRALAPTFAQLEEPMRRAGMELLITGETTIEFPIGGQR